MKYRTPDLLCYGSVMDLTNLFIPSQIHAQRALENGAAVRDVSKDIKAPPIPREESSEVIQIDSKICSSHTFLSASPHGLSHANVMSGLSWRSARPSVALAAARDFAPSRYS